MKKTRIEPNIDQLPNGRFQVDLYLKNSNTKRRERIRKTFLTLHAARKFRTRRKAENELGLWRHQPGDPITLSQAIGLAKIEKIKQFRKRNRGRQLSKDAKPATFEDMVRHMEEILSFFGSETQLNNLNEEWIDDFTDYLMSRPKIKGDGTLSNQSVDHTLKELRYVLRLAHRQGNLGGLPVINFVGNYGQRDFQLDMASFIAVVNELPLPPKPHRALLLMALNTGQRNGDLSSMKWSQVKPDHIVYRSSKTQKELIRAPLMPITKEALHALKESASTESEYIFINPKTGNPIKDVKKTLRSACSRAGVERFTMHHLRHLATTVLLECTNGDRDLVRRIIGWSNMDMIDRYGHVGSRAVPAFSRINDLLAPIHDGDR